MRPGPDTCPAYEASGSPLVYHIQRLTQLNGESQLFHLSRSSADDPARMEHEAASETGYK